MEKSPFVKMGAACAVACLVAWNAFGCGCSRTTTRRLPSANGKTVHVSAKVETATRIDGTKSLSGVVTRVDDCGVVWVESGSGNSKKRMQVQMDRIDVPSKDDSLGKQSTRRLREKIRGKSVKLEWKKQDQDGRALGVVYLGGEDVNLWMVKEGLAQYDGQSKKATAYAEAQQRAQKAGLGIWSVGEAAGPCSVCQRK